MHAQTLNRPDTYDEAGAGGASSSLHAGPQGGVMHVVGLSYRQLDYWTRRGYLRSDGNPMPGSGRPRTWSEHEVAIARAMVRLIGCGFTVSAAARLARDESESERLTVSLCDGVSLRLHPDVWSPGTDTPETLGDNVTTHHRPSE